MSESIEMKVKACFDQDSETMLRQKLESYNLGKEFNYAVAVLKISLRNSNEPVSLGDCKINLLFKVHYITPFVTEELAKAYCNELSQLDTLMMLLPVKDGKVVYQQNSNVTINNLVTITGKYREPLASSLIENLNKQGLKLGY